MAPRSRSCLFSFNHTFFALLILILGVTQNALGQEAAQLLAENAAYKTRLEALKVSLDTAVQQAVTDKTENVDGLKHWQVLAQRFVFDATLWGELEKKSLEGQILFEQKKLVEAQQILLSVKEQYLKFQTSFDLINDCFEADKRAELTRIDSKMYFDMRVRSQLPPKTLKAYGVMELAKQERDKGNFVEALQLWEQAETMVRESFKEHIDEMARWQEEAARNAEVEQKAILIKVEALLADHFVAIPAGSFAMGSESGGVDEKPVHNVTVPAFKMGKTEVTFDLYDLCVQSTSCFYVPQDEGWGRGTRPVINLSHQDITGQFLPWLNKLTGKNYRLPSEAEWEYAARAGTTTEYALGDNLNCPMARYDGGIASVCNAKEGSNRGTAPGKTYPPNAFGLHDMHGNVWEWVEDCWNPSYTGAPADGSVWTSGNCAVRVLRGGSWDYDESGLRSANRYYFSHKIRKSSYGFRLALSI
jgi:formylglycine-generating enzyme required for sulfatase activity